MKWLWLVNDLKVHYFPRIKLTSVFKLSSLHLSKGHTLIVEIKSKIAKTICQFKAATNDCFSFLRKRIMESVVHLANIYCIFAINKIICCVFWDNNKESDSNLTFKNISLDSNKIIML